MNYYLIAKFIHIVGALGFFVALGVEWFSMRHTWQSATSEQARERLLISTSAHRVGMPSMLLALISGFYMMATVWGPVAWIIVSLAALILLIVLALMLTRPRMAMIMQGLATERGTLSPSLHALLHNSLLWLSLRMRVNIALGMVFLMTVKPNLAGSLLTFGVTIVLALASALPIFGRDRIQKSSQTDLVQPE